MMYYSAYCFYGTNRTAFNSGSYGSTKNNVQFCLDKNILEIVMLNADSPALDC